jgi:hypothetical protein
MGETGRKLAHPFRGLRGAERLGRRVEYEGGALRLTFDHPPPPERQTLTDEMRGRIGSPMGRACDARDYRLSFAATRL